MFFDYVILGAARRRMDLNETPCVVPQTGLPGRRLTSQSVERRANALQPQCVFTALSGSPRWCFMETRRFYVFIFIGFFQLACLSEECI